MVSVTVVLGCFLAYSGVTNFPVSALRDAFWSFDLAICRFYLYDIKPILRPSFCVIRSSKHKLEVKSLLLINNFLNSNLVKIHIQKFSNCTYDWIYEEHLVIHTNEFNLTSTNLLTSSFCF